MLLSAAVVLICFASAADALEIMPVTQVKAGMKGVGYSVFKGAKPEPFNADIIAVIPNWKYGDTLILARLSGANLEFSGVIAGMSGSPVYIDGKLIGAVAYAWTWAKEPIAGIQPIEYMKRLWDNPPLEKKNAGAPPAAPPGLKFSRAGQTAPDSSRQDAFTAAAAVTGQYGEIKLAPIKTPLLLSGMSEEAVTFLSRALAPYNMFPMQAGGGGETSPQAPGVDDLGPGSVIGCPLVTGDFVAAAIGTVTARDGDRVLAFGHPFFNGGPSAIPMSGGEIFHAMSTYEEAFKIGAPGRVLGVVNDDRINAIGGKIGAQPEFFDVAVAVRDEASGVTKKFNAKIAQVKEMAPMMLISVIGQSVKSASGAGNELMVGVRIDADIEDFPRALHYDDLYYQDSGFITLDSIAAVAALFYNPFREVKLKNVRVAMTISHKRKTLDITNVRISEGKFRPGDTVRAVVRLKSFEEKEFTKEIKFKIPADARPGLFSLSFEGGASASQPSPVPAASFDQYFDQIIKWPAQNSITVKLVYPDKAVGLEGRELQNLPLTTTGAIVQGADLARMSFSRFEKISVARLDGVISGAASVPITIEKEFQQ